MCVCVCPVVWWWRWASVALDRQSFSIALTVFCYFILLFFFGSTLPRAGRVPRPFLTTHRHQRFIFISFDNQQKSSPNIGRFYITTQPGAQQRCRLNQQGPYTTNNIIICSQLAQKITLPKIKLFNCFHLFFFLKISFQIVTTFVWQRGELGRTRLTYAVYSWICCISQSVYSYIRHSPLILASVATEGRSILSLLLYCVVLERLERERERERRSSGVLLLNALDMNTVPPLEPTDTVSPIVLCIRSIHSGSY